MQKAKITTFSIMTKVTVFFLVILLGSTFAISGNCQSETAFTATDTFEIPSKNSNIRFATNGSYENAFLENNTWFFYGLSFYYDVFAAQKLNISVTATDCNVTINPFFMFSRSSQEEEVTRLFFSYIVEGQGTQAFNLGFDLQQGQIEAILDGKWIGLNHGWTRSPDGTVTVTAQVSNVTISYYGHPKSYLDEPDLFEDHYVVIGSTFSLVVIVGLATVFTRRKGMGES